MTSDHPLDRPIWNSLTGRRHAHLAIGGDRARRYPADVNLLCGTADDSPASLAVLGELVPAEGQLGRVDVAPPPPVPGTVIAVQVPIEQMILDTPLSPVASDLDRIDLGEGDMPDMLALAMLTKPGPFFARTGVMGDFIGVRRGGALVAMAGERMKPDGFTEVSAVCTHPDWRGHGLAPVLIREVLRRIAARGEVAFLHAYPDNPAIALYERLGFRRRRGMVLTILERGPGV